MASLDTPGTQSEDNFRDSMRRLRKERGWSQTDLAHKLQNVGLSEFHKTTIARLENNERTLALSEAIAISEVFNESLDNMFKNEQHKSPTQRFIRVMENTIAAHEEAMQDLTNAIQTVREINKVQRSLIQDVNDPKFSLGQNNEVLELCSKIKRQMHRQVKYVNLLSLDPGENL